MAAKKKAAKKTTKKKAAKRKGPKPIKKGAPVDKAKLSIAIERGERLGDNGGSIYSVWIIAERTARGRFKVPVGTVVSKSAMSARTKANTLVRGLLF
jgi:hypothetical protein